MVGEDVVHGHGKAVSNVHERGKSSLGRVWASRNAGAERERTAPRRRPLPRLEPLLRRIGLLVGQCGLDGSLEDLVAATVLDQLAVDQQGGGAVDAAELGLADLVPHG